MLKKSYWWIILFPFVLSLLIALAILTILKPLPAKLPLFYSLAWGENQLATHQQFFIIPAGIGIIALLNLVISWQLHPSQSFFKRALLVSSTIAGIILTISFIKIISNFIA